MIAVIMNNLSELIAMVACVGGGVWVGRKTKR